MDRADRRRAAGLGLTAAVVRDCWPDAPGSYTEDDLCVDPGAGLVVVSEGTGAIGGQGRPASRLAVWSVVGEVKARPEAAERRLERGLSRADEAVARLSQGWAPGLLAPFATAAAIVLEGQVAWVAHVGGCRVSRVRAGAIEALTEDQTLARALAAGRMERPPGWPAEILHAPTRRLGERRRDAHALWRVEVRAGERFLIAGSHLHRRLDEDAIAACFAAGAEELAVWAERLRGRVRDASPEGGKLTFALVEVRRGARGGEVVGGPPPRRSWLYRPGEALPEPPAELPEGPTSRWFAEMWEDVLGERG